MDVHGRTLGMYRVATWNLVRNKHKAEPNELTSKDNGTRRPKAMPDLTSYHPLHHVSSTWWNLDTSPSSTRVEHCFKYQCWTPSIQSQRGNINALEHGFIDTFCRRVDRWIAITTRSITRHVFDGIISFSCGAKSQRLNTTTNRGMQRCQGEHPDNHDQGSMIQRGPKEVATTRTLYNHDNADRNVDCSKASPQMR
jgi:hypothetical protein